MTDDEKLSAHAPANDALAALLNRRRKGKFVSLAKMDDQLNRFLTRTRRAHKIRD